MPVTAGSALLQKTAEQSFWNSYAEYPDPFDGLVDRRQSTQLTDTYPRLGAAPMPEALDADRNAKAVNEYSFTGTNVHYDSTIKVDKKLIKYQQWDEIGNLISNQGAKARAHQASLITTLLAAGNTTVCEDGQYFFDDDHTDPGAVYTTNQDNNFTAAILVPTDLEVATAIRAMSDAIYGFKDDQGDPVVPANPEASNFILMTPAVTLSMCRRVMVSPSLTGPLGNDLQNTFTVRLNPWMPVDELWFFYAGSNHKPVILQETGSLKLTDDEPHLQGGHVYYSADWWGTAIYGQWRTACLYTLT